MPLIIVRHARAGRRSAWVGDDLLRPLSARGREQATALAVLLSPYRPRRILSSPALRCVQTVAALSDAVGVPVEPVEALGEGCAEASTAIVARMAGESAVLCTHRDVASELLSVLAPEATTKQRQRLRLQKADAWVIGSESGHLVIAEHLRPETGT